MGAASVGSCLDTCTPVDIASSPMNEIHGKWCRYVRYKLSINQRELADRIRIDPSLVSRIEHGERNPTEPVWQSLAGLAGVTHSEYWQGPPV